MAYDVVILIITTKVCAFVRNRCNDLGKANGEILMEQTNGYVLVLWRLPGTVPIILCMVMASIIYQKDSTSPAINKARKKYPKDTYDTYTQLQAKIMQGYVYEKEKPDGHA